MQLEFEFLGMHGNFLHFISPNAIHFSEDDLQIYNYI